MIQLSMYLYPMKPIFNNIFIIYILSKVLEQSPCKEWELILHFKFTFDKVTINEIACAGQIYVFVYENNHIGPLGHSRVKKFLPRNCHDIILKHLIVIINMKIQLWAWNLPTLNHKCERDNNVPFALHHFPLWTDFTCRERLAYVKWNIRYLECSHFYSYF